MPNKKQIHRRLKKSGHSQSIKSPPIAKSVHKDRPLPKSDPRDLRNNGAAIVGLGASAGGLEAATQLLGALPANINFAIVIVQHLAPDHESFLPHLLSLSTPLRVLQAEQGMRLTPGRIYIIPPDRQMGIARGRVHLTPRPKERGQHLPIDYFFRSLAEFAQSRAIGVVLSGTMSDGANGLREIKGVGGIAIAQEPKSAAFDGMPRAAIATGIVDLVLSPVEIAAELVRLGSQTLDQRPEPPESVEPTTLLDASLGRIFGLLRAASGVDFTHYKLPTIRRRLQRRMIVSKIDNVEKYIKFLRSNPAELQALYRDFLIHVTRFFREPESFNMLLRKVFPKILKARKGDSPIRIWVPGCSTGEEAYSVAIALLEFLKDHSSSTPIQIFATDVSEQAIERARSGIYPDNIGADVSLDRLKRFFTRVDGSYRISKAVRDLCIFARQDLTRDPPFSKVDLILCRNVMIYLDPLLQRRSMNVFHYSLKPAGFLMLGSSETIGSLSNLFALADSRHKLFAKKAVAVRSELDFTVGDSAIRETIGKPSAMDLSAGSRDLQNEVNRIVLARYTLPAVVIDNNLKIVQFRGQTGAFLEPASGDASLDVLKMARQGLLFGLRSAVLEARRTNKIVRRDNLNIRQNGNTHKVDVEVAPLSLIGEDRHLLISFKITGSVANAEKAVKNPRRGQKGHVKKPPAESRMVQLEEELAASREYLQSIIHDLEAANEELQSANEEILSSNEELQSTNEELDTAKEELQSTNEELNTVNEELHGRNEELSRVNSDVMNLLDSVHSAIVIVAGDLRIRRFTPMAEKVLNLIPSDIGRPITCIKPNISCPDLENMIMECVSTMTVNECEVRDRGGNWYLLRIRPYKNLDNRIDGAVLSLADSTPSARISQQLKDAEESVTRAESERDAAREIVQTVRQPMLLLDQELVVRMANKSFLQTFRAVSPEIEGKPLFSSGENGVWDIPKLRQLLEDVASRDTVFEDFEIEHDFGAAGRKRLLLNARRLHLDSRPPTILLVLEEVPA